MKISAIIITLNEERNLPRALKSLEPVTDEIVVVDSGSTDGTREIAERAGARFIAHPWEGYAAQKNFAAAQAQHDWMLSIDADEALSPELAAEMERLKQAGPGDAAGFAMPRLARFRGRWIRHSGWYPDPKLRLYDRRRGRWVGPFVHEHVEADGAVRHLAGDLHHYPADSRAEQLRSVDRYTTLAARQALEDGERLILLKLATYPGWKFVESYLFRRGFLDGAAGFLIARMAGHYVCQKYEKLWRMSRAAKSEMESAEH
ncbi:MAG: glycosyltransferase family 2 protein [Acidobacteria bacterium]|nr:glycosyltransferase family 2 protein [Acidobacteriota bacterium]